MCNMEIREKAKEKNIPLWKIADKFGTTDGNFSRKLRKEFTAEEKKKALEFIEQLSSEN